LKLPHASPPVLGPFGTFAHVHFWLLLAGLLQTHVPALPGVVLEQSWPVGQGHAAIVPPAPSSSIVPHAFGYPVWHVFGVLQVPAPSVDAHTWAIAPLPQTQVRLPEQAQVRGDAQLPEGGDFVSLHSAPSPLPAQVGAGTQHIDETHEVPVPHLLQLTVPVSRHESATGAQVLAGQLSVRVQHEPTTPDAGAGPGDPLALLTQSWAAPQLTFGILPPQPSGRFVPHCIRPW
jgi:hypothetical protein